jgi:hypothetical protein
MGRWELGSAQTAAIAFLLDTAEYPSATTAHLALDLNTCGALPRGGAGRVLRDFDFAKAPFEKVSAPTSAADRILLTDILKVFCNRAVQSVCTQKFKNFKKRMCLCQQVHVHSQIGFTLALLRPQVLLLTSHQ